MQERENEPRRRAAGTQEDVPAPAAQGRQPTDAEGDAVDPEKRAPYSPFDLEADERATRPASEGWRETVVRGRGSATWLALHSVVFTTVAVVAAVIVTVVLLVWLLG